MTEQADTNSLVPTEVSEKIASLIATGVSPETAQALATAPPLTDADKERATFALQNEEHSLVIDPRTMASLKNQIGLPDAGLALYLRQDGLGAGDEIERMLMNQMLAMNGLALRATARAHSTDYVQQCDMHINQANKCSRTFATLVETLSRYRGKTSEQKVTVQHVHVHEGGQAVVGNVAAPQGGRSRARKGHSTP